MNFGSATAHADPGHMALSSTPGSPHRAAAVVGALLLAVIGMPITPAFAIAAPPSISAPAAVTSTYNGETHIADIDVTPNDSTSLAVSMSVDHGDLTLASTVGLTFSDGDGTQDATFAFNGTNANVADALADVTYRPGAYAGAATLDTQVVDGSSLYFPATGHFYQFSETPDISWNDARAAATATSLYGLQGYLATITSAEENSFVVSKLTGEGWMGATDVAVEGEWRWVTGPEGTEDSGSGRVFYRDDLDGTLSPTGFAEGPVDGGYNNWNPGEPNDNGGEDWAHFLNNGEWNDYPVDLDGNIAGYVVEYGGMAGDASTVSTDSTAITVDALMLLCPLTIR